MDHPRANHPRSCQIIPQARDDLPLPAEPKWAHGARPLSRAAAQTRSRAAAQPLKFGARPQMPNHPDFPDDFGSYEDDLPLDDPSSGLKYKYGECVQMIC